jgi:hypothetical protein
VGQNVELLNVNLAVYKTLSLLNLILSVTMNNIIQLQ